MNKEIRKWQISELKPHPKQAANFDDLGHGRIRELADNIKTHGLKHPVEILPDGTILCGHQRVEAGKMLGWTEIDVWIRKDLAEEGELACEMHMIDDNLHRRQMDKLAQARCFKRLWDLNKQLPRDKREKAPRGDARDLIARKLGCSGRNAERYLHVLETPVEVQQAFERGEISLVNAAKVAGLRREMKEELADKIQAGQKAKEVVATYFLKQKKRPVGKVLDEVANGMVGAEEEIGERMKEMNYISRKTYQRLLQGQKFLGDLIGHAERLLAERG